MKLTLPHLLGEVFRFDLDWLLLDPHTGRFSPLIVGLLVTYIAATIIVVYGAIADATDHGLLRAVWVLAGIEWVGFTVWLNWVRLARSGKLDALIVGLSVAVMVLIWPVWALYVVVRLAIVDRTILRSMMVRNQPWNDLYPEDLTLPGIIDCVCRGLRDPAATFHYQGVVYQFDMEQQSIQVDFITGTWYKSESAVVITPENVDRFDLRRIYDDYLSHQISRCYRFTPQPNSEYSLYHLG